MTEDVATLIIAVVGFAIIGPIAIKRFGKMMKSKKDDNARKGVK